MGWQGWVGPTAIKQTANLFVQWLAETTTFGLDQILEADWHTMPP